MRKRTANYVYNGRPCLRGHVGPRYSNGNCVQCLLEREIAKQADPLFAQKKRERETARHAANPEKSRQRCKCYRALNADSINAKSRYRYAYDPDVRAKILEARKQYIARHPDAARRSDAEYRSRNLEKIKERNANWRKDHLEEVRAANLTYSRLHYHNNRWYYIEKKRRREARKIMAMPPWASLDAIRSFYIEAQRQTIETGVQMSVDHIVPLYAVNETGEHIACGLHCEFNLQIVTLEYNKKKGKRIIWSEVYS